MHIFWQLTDEEILQGMTLMYDNNARNKSPVGAPMMMFVYDAGLQRMAEMWRDCGCDRTVMKLTYSEELERITTFTNNKIKFI